MATWPTVAGVHAPFSGVIVGWRGVSHKTKPVSRSGGLHSRRVAAPCVACYIHAMKRRIRNTIDLTNPHIRAAAAFATVTAVILVVNR